MYRYMFSEWWSIRTLEINHYDITRPTYYYITMSNDVARDIHCDVTMSNDVAMCTYHIITMHNDVAMKYFYKVPKYVILLLVVWNKSKNNSCLVNLGWRIHELILCGTVSLVLRTREISLHKHNPCVLSRLIKHSLVLIIIFNIVCWFYGTLIDFEHICIHNEEM